jgi:hypothetical protein
MSNGVTSGHDSTILQTKRKVFIINSMESFDKIFDERRIVESNGITSSLLRSRSTDELFPFFIS